MKFIFSIMIVCAPFLSNAWQNIKTSLRLNAMACVCATQTSEKERINSISKKIWTVIWFWDALLSRSFSKRLICASLVPFPSPFKIILFPIWTKQNGKDRYGVPCRCMHGTARRGNMIWKIRFAEDNDILCNRNECPRSCWRNSSVYCISCHRFA